MVALVLLVATSLAAIRAQAEDGFQAEFDACRALVARRSWKKARAAYETLLEKHEGDRRLVAEREGIERDLQQCLFAAGRKPPTGQELFGEAVTKFSSASGAIEFVFPEGMRDPAWDRVTDSVSFLPVKFGPNVTVTLPAEGNKTKLPKKPSAERERQDVIRARVILAFDYGTGGGYLCTTPSDYFDDEEGRQHRHADKDLPSTETPWQFRVFRLGEGPPEVLRRGMTKAPRHKRREIPPRFRWHVISQRGDLLKMQTEGRAPFDARDKTFTGGYVALSTSWVVRRDDPVSARIHGTLDRDFVKQAIASHEATAFEAWKEDTWIAEQMLPDWLLEGSAPTLITSVEVPETLPKDVRRDVVRLIRLIRFGERDEELLVPERAGLSKTDLAFVEGVLEIVLGNRARAEQLFTRLITEAPDFDHARLWRARVRLMRRDLDGARADLDATRETLAGEPELHELLAQLDLVEGDLEAARTTLHAARAAEIWTDELDKQARQIEAAVRGPSWKRAFRRQVGPFEVWSDHSQKMSADVGKLLHDGVIRYAQTFRPVPEQRMPSRVYVFSSRDGYNAFAEEIGTTLTHSAGAYMPSLHVLVIWIPKDLRDFEATVRHEGFHQYLHHFVDDAPLWFNEGWAEYFGNIPDGARGISHKTDHRGLADRVRRARSQFLPLAQLLQLDRTRFMAQAAVCYVQAWAAVTFLATSDEGVAHGSLTRYFDELLAGNPLDASYATVFGATESQLQTEFDEFLDALVAETE